MKINPPNFTQTPNELFTHLPDMGEAELKVTLAVVRDTFGWAAGGAATVRSLTELMALTGLSRQGVLNGLNAGMERGTLYKTDGPKNKAAYGLLVHEVDRSTKLTGLPSRPELIHEVDRTGQRSRPMVVNEVDRLTLGPAAPGAEKQSPERQQKEKERKERQTATAGDQACEDVAAAAGQGQEVNAQQGSAEGADAPHGADGANATSGHGTTRTPVSQIEHATSTEKVPPGAALAALTGALAGMKRTVPELIEEFTDRQAWLELRPERIRELADEARRAHGNRYRGALIDALDAEVRTLRPPKKPTKASVNDEVRARLKGAHA